MSHQPSLGRQLRDLEQEVGTPLFPRDVADVYLLRNGITLEVNHRIDCAVP